MFTRRDSITFLKTVSIDEGDGLPHHKDEEEDVFLQNLAKASPKSPTLETIPSGDKLDESSSPPPPLPEKVAELEKPDSTKSKRKEKLKKIAAVSCFCLAEIMVNLEFSLIAPFFPDEAKKKGASSFVVGAIISCAPLFVAILSPVFGYLGNYIGIRVMVGAGLLQVGISCLLFGFLVYIPISWIFIVVAFLLRIIEGVGTAMYVTAAFIIMPNLYPENVGTVMGVFDLVGGLGFVLGAPFGSALFDLGGYKLPFIVTGIMVLAIVIPAVLLVGTAAKKQEKKVTPFKIAVRILTNVYFMLLALTLLLAMAAIGFMFPTLEPYIVKHFHYSPSIVGLTILILAFSYFVSSLPFGLITDKIGHRKVFVIVGLFSIAFGYFVVSLPYFTGTPNYAYIAVGFIIIGVGTGCSVVPIYPEMLVIIGRYASAEHSKEVIIPFVSGIVATSFSIGQFFGSLLGGVLRTVASFPLTAFLFSSFALAQAILVMAIALIDRYV